ncbi:hypothetical protein Tco_0194530 [Tanacetum coccineum]
MMNQENKLGDEKKSREKLEKERKMIDVLQMDRNKGMVYDRGQEVEQKHVEIMEDRRDKCSKLVASRDKEVNMATRDFDDALVCCVKNTVEDRIIDSSAWFHATYCNEELERFKLRSGMNLKDVRYIPGLKRRLISVGKLDEEGYHAITLHLLHQSEDPVTMILLSKSTAGVAFGVAKRLSRTFKAESTGLRAKAPKMLWAHSVSTAYLIYHIPYVPIWLRITKVEWQGKDTSLTQLKVYGCDSFVKVKDVCGEAMKYTFIGNDSNEMRYNFQDMKSHRVIQSRDITYVDLIYGASSATDSCSLTKLIQKSQVVLVDIPENLTENDSIVTEHWLSSEITQSLVGAQIRVRGLKTVGSSRIVDDQMKNTLKTEHPQGGRL